MRTWRRAEWDHVCGACARPIRRGHPMQVIAIIGCAAKPIRCVLCAEGVPPSDLPPLPDRSAPLALPARTA